MPGRIELGSTTPRAGFEFCPIIPKFASLAEVPWGTRTPKKVALQGFCTLHLESKSRKFVPRRFEGTVSWGGPLGTSTGLRTPCDRQALGFFNQGHSKEASRESKLWCLLPTSLYCEASTVG
jgi:hypothetical protein